MERNAIVVGGGVGGLAAGIGLRQVGIDVSVLERQDELERAGFGMVLWPNGTRALRALGVMDAVRDVGCEIARVEFRTPRGEVLRGWSITDLAQRAGSPAIAVSRRALHGVLAAEAGPDMIRLGAWVDGISQDQRSATVHVRSGADERTDFVVAADGVRSRTRGELVGMPWPQFPPYAGYSIWHAVIDGHGLDVPAGLFTQYLGQNSRLVCTRIDRDRVYWSALGFVPAGGVTPEEDLLATVRERYRGWAEPIPSLFDRTRSDQVARRDIFGGQPLSQWGSGRITLLGDAAHPMTTVLAQGGCQALEDAVVLAESVRDAADVEPALRAYEARRSARSTSMMGLINKFNPGGYESRLKVNVRNMAIKHAFARGLGDRYEKLILQTA